MKNLSRKKKWIAVLPFIIMPLFILPYQLLDRLILLDIFGCGCVPSAQTNLLNIPYNANDLRLTVFAALTVVLSVWGISIAKRFNRSIAKWLYCAAVILVNILLTMWVVKIFMWA